jgi:outer membrane protein assembly factor BamB
MYKQLRRIKANTATPLFLIIALLVSLDCFHSANAQSVSINPAPNSSDGSMDGVNLQRTRAYNSKGLTAPKSQSWQTEKLFVIKDSISFSGQMGTLSYYGWLPTGYGYSHPILLDGAIYFTASVENGYLYTLDAATGKEKKTIKIKNVALSAPAIAGDLIYLGGSDGSFFAVNRHCKERLCL